MLKLIFEYLKNRLSITGNFFYDFLICGLIFTIFNALAYKTVGDLYHGDIIKSRIAGSMINIAMKIVLILVTILIVSGIKFVINSFN